VARASLGASSSQEGRAETELAKSPELACEQQLQWKTQEIELHKGLVTKI
jgi:hypothetical protein